MMMMMTKPGQPWNDRLRKRSWTTATGGSDPNDKNRPTAAEVASVSHWEAGFRSRNLSGVAGGHVGVAGASGMTPGWRGAGLAPPLSAGRALGPRARPRTSAGGHLSGQLLMAFSGGDLWPTALGVGSTGGWGGGRGRGRGRESHPVLGGSQVAFLAPVRWHRATLFVLGVGGLAGGAASADRPMRRRRV